MKFLKPLIKLFPLIIFANTLFAQNGSSYKIDGKIKGLANQKIYLAYYFGASQQMIVDSAISNSEGRFIFHKETKLPEGLYLINYINQKYFDLIISEQQNFSFDLDTVDVISSIQFQHSENNRLFYDYQSKMRAFTAEFKDLQLKGKTNEVAGLRKKALEFQKDFQVKSKDLLVGKIISASLEPIIPDYTGPLKTSTDSLAQQKYTYQYYRNHYFDNIDLNDGRLLRTPFIEKKWENYFTRLIPQNSDTLIKEIDRIVKPLADTELKRYLIYKITNKVETSDILGMDAVFVHMGEEYYLKNANKYDSSMIVSFKNRIKTLKPLLLGKVLPSLYLVDPNGKEFFGETIQADFTLVFLYDPDCSHCKKAAPELVKLKSYFKLKNIQVLAVSTGRNKEKWLNFINQYQFTDFINGIDIHPNKQTGLDEYYVDFYNVFDVISTPSIYLLDKNKRILAKKLAVEEIERFIQYFEKK